jgi:hypothetical protein
MFAIAVDEREGRRRRVVSAEADGGRLPVACGYCRREPSVPFVHGVQLETLGRWLFFIAQDRASRVAARLAYSRRVRWVRYAASRGWTSLAIRSAEARCATSRSYAAWRFIQNSGVVPK